MDTEARRILMLRKRLEQHTQQKGEFVEKHLSHRVAEQEVQKEVKESPDDEVADEEESVKTESETEIEEERHLGEDAAEEAADSLLSDEELREKWSIEQREISEKLVLSDSAALMPDRLRYIVGVDVSFVRGSDQGVAALAVFDATTKSVVYFATTTFLTRHRYIAGFLAYRELPGILLALQTLKKKKPELYPQLIIVHGHGILHYRACGLASHLGYITGISCLGIGKSLLFVDGLEADPVVEKLTEDNIKGNSIELWGNSGRVYGYALQTHSVSNPIYVSPGHLISAETALELVKNIWEWDFERHRLPLPIRFVEALCHEFLARQERTQTKKKRRR